MTSAGILLKERSRAVDKNKERTETAPATLGDVLFAKGEPPVPEQDWATLVQSIATGDQLAEETGEPPVLPTARHWVEPEWEQVAPGIECKLLATDMERHRVSMLVRLAPGASYPPHTHAGVEELHLLAGELWIDERKLFPGDYNYGAPGMGDQRVWSETGCTCVLITSTRDLLR